MSRGRRAARQTDGMRTLRSSVLTFGIAAVVMLVVTGCAPTEAPEPPVPTSTSPSGSSAPTPPTGSPAASPTPSTDAGLAAGFVIPPCAELLPADELVATYDDRVVLLDDGPDTYELPGPAAQQAEASAVRWQECFFGIPGSDGIGGVHIGELSSDTRDGLVEALRQAATFTEATTAGALVFSRFESGEDRLSARGIAYVFDGAAWVAVDGSLGDEELALAEATRVIEVVRSAAA